MSRIQCVAFDIGETLVDETRMWSELAQRLGVTPLTLGGVLGALIATGRDHHDLWDVLGVNRPALGVDPNQGDLYPDALECVAAVRRVGLIVGIAGNQPESIEEMLAAAGLEADFVASSAAWGVSKPDPAFFARLVAEADVPAETILYVGDRLDNDVLPARAAGMRTVFVRRGPWGHIHALKDEAALADMRVDSLRELAALLSAEGV
ncbi:HAD family hydrolase [Mycolicibacterium mucogenicum DSM 44124]|uniref:HAD family hydrolase n=1 Tax=Mycolicibacterium mucogenicum DSM 44124 TaxID=1226753 RepID=A0A8H2JHL6_MYCMU|nr:HAD family hydrolase [Mycolicibacterium mucogenicum DSM 44124]